MDGQNGKVAWITGAGSGIGEGAARALADIGVTVVLSGRRESALRGVADAIEASGTPEIDAAGDAAEKAMADRFAKGEQ